MDKYQYFNGLKFTRDDKTGYYLNSTIRKRLHRYVWEYHNGKIPKGYHVHHIDHDKSNNDISNLKLINAKEHVTMHSAERGLTHYEELVKNLEENVRPKASEWHGSEAGKKWHSEHAKKMAEIAQIEKLICKQCNKEFETIKYGNKKLFCSDSCKAKHRRESGIDNETRKCEHCNKEFVVNKYNKAKYCSRSCSKSAYWEAGKE